MFGMFAGLGVGFLQPVQVGVNNQLRFFLRSPFYATLVSFMVSSGFVALLLLPGGAIFSIPFANAASEPLWIWFGGVCGIGYLTSLTLLMPKLGAVQIVILPMLGQILTGMLIDRFALFGSPRVQITALRLFGILLIVVGIILVTVFKQKKQTGKSADSKEKTGRTANPALRVIAVAIGAFSASQTAINGTLGSVLGSTLQASLISCSSGCAILVLISLGIFLSRRARCVELPARGKGVWWMWIGGIMGGLIVLVNATLSQQLGTGLTVVLFVTGQMIGGVVLDQFGLLHTPKRPMTLGKLCGVILALVGVVLIRLF